MRKINTLFEQEKHVTIIMESKKSIFYKLILFIFIVQSIFSIHAQTAPNISYATPRNYLINSPITTLTPTNSGGSVPALTYKEVTTIAGTVTGFLDGTGTAAKMDGPLGMKIASNGDVYFVDAVNHRIRKMTPAGVVTTIAGNGALYWLNNYYGVWVDNPNGANASFNWPIDLALDTSNNCLYVTDKENNRIRKVSLTAPYAVTTFAGSGTNASADGNGTAAAFSNPNGIEIDPTGSYLYVTDKASNKIRRITISTAQVITIAGNGTSDTIDNAIGTSASFKLPTGIAVDANYIYVADSFGHKIRKIAKTSPYAVTTFAGSGTSTAIDGVGINATFDEPQCLTLDGAGNLYVSEWGLTKNIRKISPGGVVTTLAGGASGLPVDGNGTAAGFNYPANLAINPSTSIGYISDWYGDRIRKIELGGYTITPALPAGLSFNNTTGVISGTPTALNSGPVNYTITAYNYYGESTTTVAITIGTLPSLTTTIVSNVTSTTGVSGGNVTDSGGVPLIEKGICWSTSTNPTISDNKVINNTTAIGNFASTISGLTPLTTYYVRAYATNIFGTVYGTQVSFTTIISAPIISYTTSNQFTVNSSITPLQVNNTGGEITNYVTSFATNYNTPYGLTVDSTGNLYMTDLYYYYISKFTPAGVGSTFAGNANPGGSNGTGTAASFYSPYGLAIDAAGNIYVADKNNNKIRKITPTGVVTNFAGSGTAGAIEGTGNSATFNNPKHVAVDAAGNVYVADTGNNKIRKITPTGIVSTFAGNGTSGAIDGTGTTASFNNPSGVAVDPNGNVYVADMNNHEIRKITPSGMVSTFAGNGAIGATDGTGTAASFKWPSHLTLDPSGNLYIADMGNHKIRKINSSGVVSTFAGNGINSMVNSSLTLSSFNSPQGVALDASGNVYVADSGNGIIRKITLGYSISPALPSGLVLNSDGSISGTPTGISPATNYVVTATNAGGSSSYTLTIEIVNKIEWTGNTSTAWNTASNWSNNTVPTSTDNVVINTSTPNAPTLNEAYTVGYGKTLTIGNTGTLKVAPNASLTIAGTADFGHKSVTFKSDATGTGVLGTITGSLVNADNVTTERYIPAKRAFRFLSSSVTTTTSIKANWQEGVNNSSVLFANNQNPKPGFGTHITGSSSGSNGFDASQSSNASLFGFDNSSGQWTTITNTDTNILNAGSAYRLMVRGDRSVDLSNNAPTPTPTTLRATGTLFKGSKTISGAALNQAANGYSLIGNPYQAPVDMKAVLDASSGLATQFYYVWDPTQNTRGAYVSVDVQNGVNSIFASSANKYLQPGQAAFIRKDATTNAASVTFLEANKYVVATNENVFRLETSNLSLLKVSMNSNGIALDGFALVFDTNSNNAIDANDAGKLGNLDEDLATSNNGSLSSIESRQFPVNNEEIQLYATKFRTTNYTLKTTLENYSGPTPYLLDTYTQNYTLLNGNTETIYPFSVDSTIPNSVATNRFKIVFRNNALSTTDFEKGCYLYPNPSTDSAFYVHLNELNSSTKVTLFNTLGQQIPMTVNSSENNSFFCKTISKLPSGAYFVEIEQEGKKATKKWIVQ